MPDQRPVVPIMRPSLDQPEIDAVSRVLRSGWVTQGPEVAAFEQEFAEAIGARYACAVANCTTALHLALLTLGVGPGDEVVTVSHSFIATANAIRYCHAIPVFVDIDPGTFNIEPALIEAALSERTRAILVVHQMGMPADLRPILDLAGRHSLPVVEDAACAIGSTAQYGDDDRFEAVGRPRGVIGCFSFHPRKVLTTGDGGMLTTADEGLLRTFRLLRQHGMSVSDSERHTSRRVIFESYPVVGFNYRMTDLQAAVGREQLKRLPAIVTRRRERAERYRAQLATVAGIGLPREPEWARSNWQSYCVRLLAGFDQRTIMESMLGAGIATRRGVMCIHREAAYPPGTWRCGVRDCHGNGCDHLAASEAAQRETIVLPLFHDMTDAEQDSVVTALRLALDEK